MIVVDGLHRVLNAGEMMSSTAFVRNHQVLLLREDCCHSDVTSAEADENNQGSNGHL